MVRIIENGGKTEIKVQLYSAIKPFFEIVITEVGHGPLSDYIELTVDQMDQFIEKLVELRKEVE